MATLEQLERRLTVVEQELAVLRKILVEAMTDPRACNQPRMMLESRLNQPALSAAVEKTCKEMGLVGEPPGIEKLREMLLAAGVNPEDNEFSREIDAGRGE